MVLTLLNESVERYVKDKGDLLVSLEPDRFIIVIVSATLIPLASKGANSYQDLRGTFGVGSETWDEEIADVLQRVYSTEEQKNWPDDLLQAQLERVITEKWQEGYDNGSKFRRAISAFLQSTGSLETALRAASKELRKPLLNCLQQIPNLFTEFHWLLDLREFGDHDVVKDIIPLPTDAVVKISPNELVETYGYEITPAQKSFLDAIQTWHLEELGKVEQRAAYLRRRVRILLGILAALLFVVIVVLLFGIQSRWVARQRAAEAATNVNMAVQLAEIAGTDVVVAGTARVASTQGIATAQYASTQLIEQRATADQQNRESLAEELAAQSLALLDKQLDLALLLAIEANNLADTTQTRSVLHTALSYNPLLERFLQGNRANVLSLDYSRDGKWLVSGSVDDKVTLWDMTSGRLACQISAGHGGYVNSVVFSPLGELVASAGQDGIIRLWSLSQLLACQNVDENAVETLVGHTAAIYDLAFSPDGAMLASASGDGTVRTWNVTEGVEKRVFIGHKGRVVSVAFSPNGHTVASGGDDATIHLWDVDYGGGIGQTFTGQNNPVNDVTFSPDGNIIASATTDGEVRLWNAGNLHILGSPWSGHQGNVLSVAFRPDGRFLASGGDDGILLWELSAAPNTGVLRGYPKGESMIGSGGSVTSLKFSPDGKFLASGEVDQWVRLWNISIALGDEVRGGEVLSGHQEAVYAVDFSPDSQLLASASWDKTIRLWSKEEKEKGTTNSLWKPFGSPILGHTDYVLDVKFSPDGKMLASCSLDKTVRLWEVVTGATDSYHLLQVLSAHTDWVRSVAFSPDGATLVSGGWDKTARLWEKETQGFVSRAIYHHQNTIYSLSFSPDGKLVAIGGEGSSKENNIVLWDISRDSWLPFRGQSSTIYDLAISPSGDTLATGGDNHALTLWDMQTIQVAGSFSGRSLTGHSGDILSIAFSPDGTMLASGSSDNSIILWDVKTGYPIGRPLLGHRGFVYSVAFSADGKLLASAGSDKKVIVWDLDLLSWKNKACRRAGRNLSQAEWLLYFPHRSYQETCHDFP